MTARPSKLRKLLLGAVMIGSLVVVSLSQKHLNHQREVLDLTRITPLDNAPPVLAFTTKALGGFRGLIANALWIRANELQDEGKYFEMVQLADWITKLEPNLSAVWVHLAWNMSYNISIKFNEPEDRWHWVMRGIELLRDEGLKYNPEEPLIYRELAWHFQHKLGHYLDDAHQYYKWRWAQEMAQVLGKRQTNWVELLNPDTPDKQERLRTLKEKYKMDPHVMKRVDEEYGPLEWRLPEAHAIYWAVRGLDQSKHQQLKKEDFITLRRVIFQSLQLAFMRGRLIYPDKTGNDFVYGPNLEIIRQASDAYVEQAKLEPQMEQNILNAHKNFLGMAVYHLYTHNRREAARRWFAFLQQEYPNATKYKDLDEYALSRIAEDVGETDPNRVKTIIMGAYETAFVNYSIGEDDVAVNHEIFAQKVRQRYMTEIGKGEKQQQRVGLPALSIIRDEALKNVLGPDYGLDPTLRQQLLTRLGLPMDYGMGTTNNVPQASVSSAERSR